MQKKPAKKQPSSSLKSEEAKAPGLRELKRQRFRKAIIAAGRKVFCETHFVTASIEDIALRANVSRPTFYRYFPDKDTVLREILMVDVEIQSTLWRKLAALGDPTDKELAAWFADFIKLMQKNSATVALFHIALGIDTSLIYEISNFRDRYISILGESIAAFRLKGNGSQRDKKQHAAAHLLIYQVDQACVNLAFPGGNLEKDALIAGLVDNFRRFIETYS
jgi:AcrR family transcriptional regulator